MKLREYVAIGYIAANGYVFMAKDCKRYNQIQDEINGFIKANMPVRDGLADHSCKMFKQITGLK